ncbi:MAG: FAD-dependent oxidoreductase, partial [Pseudohongiellaceae bacterium]
DPGQYLTLENAQARLAELREYAAENFVVAAAVYLAAYILFTTLSVPGALLFTLLGGAVFGLLWGTVLVSFASSIGATLAFLLSRLLLHDWVQRRFGDYLAPLNRGIERDGAFYLFSIRMVPLFPFFMINLLSGLTTIRLREYYIATQSGMLLATIVFVNAGVELAQIETMSGLISGPVLISFALLGIFPLVAKFAVDSMRRNRILKPFKKPTRFDANVVVIGAGSAGLVASLIVAGSKAKVILIEKHRMGGDCLNTGCVPSKTLIRSARIAAWFKRANEFGLKNAHAETDFPAVMQRVKDVIRQIEPHDSVERFTALGVECVMGEARIVSPYTVEVNGRAINTRAIILATGARPQVPEIPGLAAIDYLTSDSVWSLEQLPERLLILGAGPIGCELAQAFHNLGSRVTLLEQAQNILPREDSDVAELLTDRFRAEGITVVTGHKVTGFTRLGNEASVTATNQSSTVNIGFDRVLLALGRKANVEGFGLEALNMPLTPQGSIEVNDLLQTAFPNIFACGDVAGPYQFTHMASYQAWYAALNALLGRVKSTRINYRVVPWATFTSPEVARVGLNEQEAGAKNIAYELTRYELADFDRAIADGENSGFIKVLTVPGKDRILGVTIAGYHAGEMIGEFVFAMTHGMGLKKISAVTHIYPTHTEANKFAANAWRSARLPVRLFPWLEKYFRWQRNE